MAEGLAAIGLAGNIIQFITFGSALVSKSREIHRSASGLSTELVDLNVVARDIKYFSSRISADAGVSDRLYDIAEASSHVAHELVEAIADIQKNDQASISGPTKWKSFRKALKCIWRKEMIDEMKSRLELLRNQLSLHLISDTNDDQKHLLQLVQEWRKQNERSGYQITNRIQALDTQLSIIKQHSAGFSFDLEYWKKLYDMLCKVSDEVRQVSHGHTILQSLRYECMETRMEAIKEAHQRTFDWMFDINMGQLTGLHWTTPFTEWLESGSGIYWVTGKPGCGKSTLMKYLYHHAKTDKHLNAWAGTATLVRASFYFWNPGEEMQKSLEGLLQTLLYHILRTCPELIPVLCPERWNEQHVDMKSVRPWTLGELQTTIAAFQAQPSVAAKFYFHIDGLDEYFGDSWDVVDTVQNFAGCSNIKLCLSSRPWNSFQDAFGRSNPCMLRLHGYTRKDIETFAHDNLTSYATHSDFEPRLFNDMIQDIVERAQGVFLWVRLVVRSLREGIINDDPVALLHERLRTIPSDLEMFFEQILQSVDSIYKTRMATTFLAALRTHRPLNIIQYHFLKQDNMSASLEEPFQQLSDAEIQRRVHRTERRLNGQFRGLLEPSSTTDIGKHTTVDFLHRTLRDFLATQRMKKWLESSASQDINVLMAMSRALIFTFKFIYPKPALDDIKIAIEMASLAAQETGNTPDSFAIVDQAEIAYKQGRSRHQHVRCGFNCYIIRFAICAGHKDYLPYRCRKDSAKLNLNNILAHAIDCPLKGEETYVQCLLGKPKPRVGGRNNAEKVIWDEPTPSIVRSLLEFGADPNASVSGVSSWIMSLNVATRLMDGPQKGPCQILLQVFCEGKIKLISEEFDWGGMIFRDQGILEAGLRNTHDYLDLLLSQGISPDIATNGTTLFKIFLRFLTKYSPCTSGTQTRLHHRMLRRFLESGADMTQVHTDQSPDSWLSSFTQELVTLEKTSNLAVRIEEFTIFMEHGMQLNSELRGDITIWYWLLVALHRRLQQICFRGRQLHILHRIILLSLQHGADPYAPGLPRILDWVRGDSCLLTAAEKAQIEHALPQGFYEEVCTGESQCEWPEDGQAGDGGAAGKRKGWNLRICEEDARTKRGKYDHHWQ